MMPSKNIHTIGYGAHLRSQVRELIYGLKEYYSRERDNNGPNSSLTIVLERTFAVLKIGTNTITSIGNKKTRKSLREDI